MRKRLQKAFLLGLFLSLSLMHLGATVRWADEIVWKEKADKYVRDENLILEGNITISHDVYILAWEQDVTVSVSKDNVWVYPYPADPADRGVELTDIIADPSRDWGHLIFQAREGKKILVECYRDLIFNGLFLGTKSPDKVGDAMPYNDDVDLIITFSDKGEVIFKLADFNDDVFPDPARFFPDQTYEYAGNQRRRGAEVRFDGNGSGSIRGEEVIFQAGTKVYILMDQTKDNAIDEGKNKVTFQRMSYGGTTDHTGFPTGVRIGRGSFITYLSTDAAGLGTEFIIDSIVEGTNYPNGGFGTLAFDPTHDGKGRMYLFIHGAETGRSQEAIDSFHDGSLMVSGHFVPKFEEAYIRTLPYLNATAGQRAIFRINDSLRFEDWRMRSDSNPGLDERRGLLVINENTTVPQMASDPYQMWNLINETNSAGAHPNQPLFWAYDLSWIRSPYANCINISTYNIQANPFVKIQPGTVGLEDLLGLAPTAYTYNAPWTYNTQTGFIVGVNGWMDVYHRTFLDYVAMQRNQSPDLYARDDNPVVAGTYSAIDPSPMFKRRNPAALHIDGLNVVFGNNDPLNDTVNNNDYWVSVRGANVGTVGTWYSAVATNATTNPHPTHARTVFYGDGRIYLRCGVYDLDSDNPAVPFGQGYGPWFTPDGDLVYTLSIDETLYQTQDPLNNEDICLFVNGPTASIYEGVDILDVEGRWSVYTRLRNDAPPQRLDGAAVSNTYVVAQETEKGVINTPPVLIDHTGRELLDWTNATYIERPLVPGTTYQHYNSASMFFNITPVDLYDVVLMHNDVLKYVTSNPSNSWPAMVGSEALVFNNNVYPTLSSDPALFEYYEVPKIRWYNSDLNMHESLVSSGLRHICSDLRRNIITGAKITIPDGDRWIFEEYVTGPNSDNSSTFRCYDHGDNMDTLNVAYGRVCMFGCAKNLMDDGSINKYTESTYVNVFRSNDAADLRYDTDGDNVSNGIPADTIKLSWKSIDEPNILRIELINPIDRQRATHLVLFSYDPANLAASYMSLGWTDTWGNDFYFPWESRALRLGEFSEHYSITTPYIAESNITDYPGTSYPASTTAPWDYVQPATNSVDGNYFYFGGTDLALNMSKVPVSAHGKGGILYANHGGRFQVTQPTPGFGATNPYHGYDCFFDTTLAYRLWDIEGLCGIIDLPKDQIRFGNNFAVQPYDLPNAILNGMIRARGYSSTLAASYPYRITDDRRGEEEYTIAWRRRPYDSNFTPVKAIKDKFGRYQTRYTAVVTDPVELPSNLLFFANGDVIGQLKVAGATMADPLHLLITGNNTTHGYGWVKEIVSIPSDPKVYSEGDHAAIFLAHGGRVGLGSRDWDEYSKNAWNILGRDHVTICPDAGPENGAESRVGIVDVNSDLIVADPLAIVPTNNFGSNGVSRLTFRSDDYKEIRIPAGGALDLTSLGANGYRQEIEIGGRLRLIFEPGSTLRFPSADITNVAPILYLNDEAELIFEGDYETGKGRYDSLTAADSDKIRIMGSGEIWVNKDAKIRVMGNAKVSVRTDDKTRQTDIGISIRRQGQFYIGDEDEKGGSFEVGNPTDRNSVDPVLGNTMVRFSLRLDGPKARFQIDRHGFFGLGVGIINNEYDNPNGIAAFDIPNPNTGLGGINPNVGAGNILTWSPDSTAAWQVAALYNVNKIFIDVVEGVFDHSNIFAGSDRRASMMAIGPISDFVDSENVTTPAEYEVRIEDKDKARILGGGNLMSLPVNLPETSVYINAWQYADPVDRTDGTRYSILASAPVMLQKQNIDIPGSTVNSFGVGGLQFLSIGNHVVDTFEFLAYPYYSTLPVKYVDCGGTLGATLASYVNDHNNIYPSGGKIFRRSDIYIIGEGAVEDGLEDGILGSTGPNEPIKFTVVKKK